MRTAVTLCLIATSALAGKYNEVLSIGDPVPTWEKLPGVDGKSYSLKDFADKDVLVVVFTCNSCPYAVDYEDRLTALGKEIEKNQSSVALVAVNVNKVPEDLPEAMKKRAQEKGFSFPYLFDETQKIARDFGAMRTPEFFVFDKSRKLVYTGAMDDNADPAKVSKDYLRAAIAATKSGQSVEVAETPPVGCAVRFERARRTKRTP